MEHFNIMMSHFCLKSQSVIIFFLTFAILSPLSAGPPPLSERLIVIDKAQKRLVLFRGGKEMAGFPAAFGIDPDSDKYKAFDAATPEGLYSVTHKKARTRFHRFVGISYPNLSDAARGLANGVISPMEYRRISQALQKSGRAPCDTGLGCGLGIHGGGVFRYYGKGKETDWTEGCVALNNRAMETVFNFCRSGDPVIIYNSRRNLCGIISPFTGPKELDVNGLPKCPDGICTYQVEMRTSLGRMTLTTREGREFGRSLEVTVHADNGQNRPLLVIVDRNGDGELWAMDSISGPMADQKNPQATYQRVREAVIGSLSRGEISDWGGGR